MANTIARIVARDKSRDKTAHRIGSLSSYVSAATWRTEARALVRADGSGVVEVLRDGELLHTWTFGSEAASDAATDAAKGDGEA